MCAILRQALYQMASVMTAFCIPNDSFCVQSSMASSNAHVKEQNSKEVHNNEFSQKVVKQHASYDWPLLFSSTAVKAGWRRSEVREKVRWREDSEAEENPHTRAMVLANMELGRQL